MAITLKTTPAEIAGMRLAGRLASEVLDMLTPHVMSGAITDDLDKLAREFVLDHGALPACLYYRGYSKTVCISPNHVVCHGIPNDKKLKNGDVVNIDLSKPMSEILATLSKHPVKTRLSLTGTIIVARDLAHAKIRERLERGDAMPDYFKNHPIYYAGPAKTPEGYASGSFGPTTAGRMDSYVEQFQAQGGSMVMLAKGNRSSQVREACAKHGGFYLGSIGGPAARLAQDCIKKVEVLEYPELGMEAIWKVEVENFPAFIVIDDKGNDFFKELHLG
jgi:tartrate/fumarate subfamily iron-sulfur-dependent hydro-lyase beta chain